MKMKIQKTFTAVIDTGVERERINEAFEDRPEERAHLNKLMDLIEAQKWEEAEKELEGEWWNGRDDEQECPRLEFVGLLESLDPGFDPWDSYAELVYRFANRPENYKVLSISD